MLGAKHLPHFFARATNFCVTRHNTNREKEKRERERMANGAAAAAVGGAKKGPSATAAAKEAALYAAYHQQVRAMVETFPTPQSLNEMYRMHIMRQQEREEKELKEIQARLQENMDRVRHMGIILERKLNQLAVQESIVFTQRECATPQHWYALLELVAELPGEYLVEADEEQTILTISIQIAE